MRIALAQLDYQVGNFAANYAKILAAIRELQDQADLLVFSELALSGYYPMDLLDRPGFGAEQARWLKMLSAATRDCPAGVLIGCATPNLFAGKPWHNSLVLLERGAVRSSYQKMLLPTYNIFAEQRHFEPGARQGLVEFRGRRLGLLICEDAWQPAGQRHYGTDPVALLAQERLDLVISCNASPANRGKQAERLAVLGAVARRLQAPLIYVNQVGANDDVVFDGASFALAQDGTPLFALPACREATGVLQLQGSGTLADVTPGAFTPLPQPLADLPLCAELITLGLRDYLAKTGLTAVVVGSSGGIDSALTLALAVRALGPERVTAITMPARYSSAGSVNDSVALCANLGIPLITAPIEPEFATAEREYAAAFGAPLAGLAAENLQARLRGMKLMAFANSTGALVLSTGNKSELAVGYATLYGDMNGGLNLIGDLYKTEVFALARLLNQEAGRELIPAAIIAKEPSAELAPGQKDSDALPPYPVLDAILKLYLEQDLLPRSEQDACLAELAGTDPALPARVVALVDRAEFKRKQAPPIIRLQRRSFGAGRQLLVSAGFTDPELFGRFFAPPTPEGA